MIFLSASFLFINFWSYFWGELLFLRNLTLREWLGGAGSGTSREASTGQGRPGRDNGFGALPGQAWQIRHHLEFVLPGLLEVSVVTGSLSSGFSKVRRQLSSAPTFDLPQHSGATCLGRPPDILSLYSWFHRVVQPLGSLFLACPASTAAFPIVFFSSFGLISRLSDNTFSSLVSVLL